MNTAKTTITLVCVVAMAFAVGATAVDSDDIANENYIPEQIGQDRPDPNTSYRPWSDGSGTIKWAKEAPRPEFGVSVNLAPAPVYRIKVIQQLSACCEDAYDFCTNDIFGCAGVACRDTPTGCTYRCLGPCNN
jgi:hypothetical protein